MMIYTLGPFRLDTHDGLLLRGTEPVALGRRAIALLRALVEQPGALLSKDALIEAAWSGQAVEESNLTVQIAALRRTLGATPGGDRWIETMPGRGYRFIGPVVPEARKSTPDEFVPLRLSMVVVPFANFGGDLEQEHFVDGITESLTTDLSRIRGAVVIARNTAFAYKGKALDAKQIGRELNVRYVLEGSVQRGGNRMPSTSSSSTPRRAIIFGPSGSISPSPISSTCRTKSSRAWRARPKAAQRRRRRGATRGARPVG